MFMFVFRFGPTKCLFSCIEGFIECPTKTLPHLRCSRCSLCLPSAYALGYPLSRPWRWFNGDTHICGEPYFRRPQNVETSGHDFESCRRIQKEKGLLAPVPR